MRAKSVGYKAQGEKQGLIFVISGPSGTGKTTLLAKLHQQPGLKHKLARSISLTTRPRRSGERNGRDYFFVSQKQFQQKIRQQKVLEYTKYLGYYYGTLKDFIVVKLKKGKSPVLCLDLKGAQSVKCLFPGKTTTIFVVPPSLGVLGDRIRRRCGRTHAKEIKQRLRLAKKEMASAAKYDYSVLNKDLDKAAEQLSRIIIREIKQT